MQISSTPSLAHDATLILIAAGIGLVSKIVWDWLKIRRNGNGHVNGLEVLASRNEKSFENALKIFVIPVMTRTNEILEEMKESNRSLTEALISLRLRDEARELVARGRGTSA